MGHMEKAFIFPAAAQKKGGAAGEKRRASACQHAYHTHIFPGKCAGTPPVPGSTVRAGNGSEGTGEDLFSLKSKKNNFR